MSRTRPPGTLRELARLFLKLGTIGFGGPAAHIALMEDEVVRRRKWLTSDEFLDLIGATNLIPGPNSTELAIHIGRLRGGAAGLLVAGTAFILPAAAIVTGIAWAYTRFGKLSPAAAVLYGVKPVVIAIIVQALLSLGRTAVKSTFLALVGVATLAATLVLLVNEVLLLAVAGVTTGLVAWVRQKGVRSRRPPARSLALALPLASSQSGSAAAAGAGIAAGGATLWPLFLVFLKAGSVLFGSGYVLLAFLRADLVERLGWLSNAELIDAIAVGQMTPGPVFTTATFIGYVLAGLPGASVATVGIFLPAFVFVALSGPLVPAIRRSPVAGAVLDGVNVASLALMAAVTGQLASTAIVDTATAVLAALSALLVLRYRVNASWLILGGALVGLVSTA